MLTDIIDSYLTERAVGNLAPSTLEQYRNRLQRVAAWLRHHGRTRWVDVQPVDLDALFLDLVEQGLSWSTRRGIASALTDFCAWLVRLGKVLSNPARDLPVPTDDLPPLPHRPLSEQEVDRLIAAIPRRHVIDLRNRLHVELLYGCALRRTEVQQLDVSDLLFPDRAVLVRDGKGGKSRLVPMMKGVLVAAEEYLAVRRQLVIGPDTGALLLTARNLRVPHATFAQWLAKLGCSIGLKVHPHLLRHSIAVHLLRGGADIRHIQVFLGHADVETTKIYLRMTPGHLRRDYDAAMPEIQVRTA